MIETTAPDPEINELLNYFCEEINKIVGPDLVGVYLFGSLSYGDFKSDRSDIDVVAILQQPLNQHMLNQVQLLHQKMGERYPKWRERLECSYTPIEMFKNILPPKEPRPYFGGGIFYDEAPYGNEWIINNYLLYQHGMTLVGENIKQLIPAIDMLDVQKACIRDLFAEWEPKMSDDEWLSNPHYQSYLVLNLCRILYTVMQGVTGTKSESATWVKNKYGSPWVALIEQAETWKYGEEISGR